MKSFAKSFLQISLGIGIIISSIGFVIFASSRALAQTPEPIKVEGNYVFYAHRSSDGEIYYDVFDASSGVPAHFLRKSGHDEWAKIDYVTTKW